MRYVFMILCVFVILGSTTLAANPDMEYLRQDLRELAKAVGDFSRTTTESIAILRTRQDTIEKMVTENKVIIDNNRNFIEGTRGSRLVTGEAWNYLFVLAIAVTSSAITAVLNYVIQRRNNRGQ